MIPEHILERQNAHHGSNIGRSLGQNPRPVVEIRRLIAGDWCIPRLVKVVEHNIRVCDDGVCVDMVDKIVANR